MGTLAIGGYVGQGLAKLLVQKVPGVGDILGRLNLSANVAEGGTQIIIGLAGDVLLKMAGVPAKWRTPIREGVVLFGIKALLDDFVETNVYSPMGLSDYVGYGRYGLNDYLTVDRGAPMQLGNPYASYGARIPSYNGNPFSR